MSSLHQMKSVRIHIGNISKQLCDNITVLTDRLAKFGELKSDLELHTKETIDGIKYFGFINLSLNDESLRKLLQAFNKVKFMNSDLVVDQAKPSFNDIHQRDQASLAAEEAEAAEKLRIQELKHTALTSRIEAQKSNKVARLRNYSTVIEGAIRKQPRVKDSRRKLNVLDISYRVKFLVFDDKTGEWQKTRKIIKPNHKQKLWGYDKSKTSTDLVFKFQNGVWKNGNGEIVEKVKTNGVIPEVKVDTKKEISKTKNVLDDFLNSYDFENFKEFSYEKDRREKLDDLKNKVDYEQESRHVDWGEEEEDSGEVSLKTNATETLKSTLNPETQGGFTFNLEDSDIEEGKEEDTGFVEQQIVTDKDRNYVEPQDFERKKSYSLFFPHFDSPFLVAQTQFSMLTPFSADHDNITKWMTKEFNDSRVDLMKKFRKRRRDVLRSK